MSKKKNDEELDNVMNWIRSSQRQLEESLDALDKLDDIKDYGHYTLDVTIGGSCGGPDGNGWQEVEACLDFLDKDGAALKKYQEPLFDCLRAYLRNQVKHYQAEIAGYRRRIKKLA